MLSDTQRRGYWTGFQLAPRLPILISQLSSLDEQLGEYRRRMGHLDKLPYSLGGMCYSFFEFLRTQQEIIQEAAPERGVVQILSSDVSNPLAFALDGFLDHGRRAANATVFYMSARFRVSLPKSMADFVKRLGQEPELPKEIRQLVMEYWESHGARLKAYRDLAQHHALIASDARVFLGKDGEPGAYLALPNNPETKKVKDLSYENPTVHAFLYMRRGFYELIRFANRLVRQLIDPTKPTNRASFGTIMKGPIRSGEVQNGVRIAPTTAFDAGIEKLLARLAEESGD